MGGIRDAPKNLPPSPCAHVRVCVCCCINLLNGKCWLRRQHTHTHTNSTQIWLALCWRVRLWYFLFAPQVQRRMCIQVSLHYHCEFFSAHHHSLLWFSFAIPNCWFSQGSKKGGKKVSGNSHIWIWHLFIKKVYFSKLHIPDIYSWSNVFVYSYLPL